VPSDVQERNVELVRSTLGAGDQEGLRSFYARFDEFCHPDLEWRWAILYRIEDGLLRSGTAFDSHAEAEDAARA
jgi:hypothetical protein